MKAERVIEWIISIPILVLLPIVSWALWLTHRDMIKEHSRVKRIKKATYREIKNKLLNTNWEFDPLYPRSLFCTDWEKAYFHASVFEFNGVGYLLTPYGYFMASFLQLKIRKGLPTYKKMHDKPYIN